MPTIYSKDGKTATTIINRWDGGIANDPRDTREGVCRMVSNFDVFTNPRKMTPYRSSEDGDAAVVTNQNGWNALIALRTGTTYSLYTLGRQSAANRVLIRYKTIGVNVDTSDLDDAGWTTTTNNEGNTTLGSNDFNLFVYYQKTGLIYGTHGGTNIWAYDPSGTLAFANTHFTVTYTNVAQGLVHSKDDILYVPIDNKIYSNDNGVWTLALTLPSHFYITSICEMGNNIAIAMTPLSAVGTALGLSRVFIWDRNFALTTLAETIPWEEGQLQILEVIDGYLVGISRSGLSLVRHNYRIIFRYLDGNNIMGYRAKKLFEIISPTGQESAPPASSSALTTALPIAKQMVEGRLHFLMKAYVNGEQRSGVWSIGRVGENFVLNHERTPNNDTIFATVAETLYNFFYVGDYLFIAYDGTV